MFFLNNFKKLCALILSVVFVFTLSSCGNKSTEAEVKDKSASDVSEATENSIDKTVSEEKKDNTPSQVDEKITSSFAKSETSSTTATTATTAKTESTKIIGSKNSRIKKLYIEALNNNQYKISEINPSQTHPTYSLYDFDKDGTPELLIWAVRIATYEDRNIYVYKYNAEYDKLDYLGAITVCTGHSEIGESLEKNGIVVATRDKGDDTITKYTIVNDKIVPTVLLYRGDESNSDWYNIITSSKYAIKFDLKEYREDKDLDTYFS